MSSLTGKHGEEEDYLSKNNKIDKLVVMIKKIVLLLTMMALAIGAEAKGVTSQTAADMAKELVAERVERFAAKVQSVTPMARLPIMWCSLLLRVGHLSVLTIPQPLCWAITLLVNSRPRIYHTI